MWRVWICLPNKKGAIADASGGGHIRAYFFFSLFSATTSWIPKRVACGWCSVVVETWLTTVNRARLRFVTGFSSESVVFGLRFDFCLLFLGMVPRSSLIGIDTTSDFSVSRVWFARVTAVFLNEHTVVYYGVWIHLYTHYLQYLV